MHLKRTCSQEYFHAVLQDGASIILAYHDEVCIGYCKYGNVELPIPHAPEDREIHRLYVSAAYQAHGVGRMLFTHALEDETMRAAGSLFLGVWEDNAKALAFYARFGFTPVGEYLYYVGTHADREIILRRQQK